MLWTTNLVQLLLAVAATGEQPGDVIDVMMANACGSTEAASAVGMLRRTAFSFLYDHTRQKWIGVSVTSLMAVARMVSSRIWWASLMMGEESSIIRSLWVLVKVGQNRVSGLTFLVLRPRVARGSRVLWRTRMM